MLVSKRKAAALSGVLYYLSEEKRAAANGRNGGDLNPGLHPWILRSRRISARLNQSLQDRQFLQPFGIQPQPTAGANGETENGRIDVSPHTQFKIFSRIAGIRNTRSRKQWKSRS